MMQKICTEDKKAHNKICCIISIFYHLVSHQKWSVVQEYYSCYLSEERIRQLNINSLVMLNFSHVHLGMVLSCSFVTFCCFLLQLNNNNILRLKIIKLYVNYHRCVRRERWVRNKPFLSISKGCCKYIISNYLLLQGQIMLLIIHKSARYLSFYCFTGSVTRV